MTPTSVGATLRAMTTTYDAQELAAVRTVVKRWSAEGRPFMAVEVYLAARSEDPTAQITMPWVTWCLQTFASWRPGYQLHEGIYAPTVEAARAHLEASVARVTEGSPPWVF